MQDGDIINIDVTPVLNGWHGDTSRMFYVGKVKLKAIKLVETTYEAMMKGIEKIKPGNTFGDIGNAIQTHAEKNGLSVVRDFTGHGLGRVFHAPPTILHYGQPNTGDILEEGLGGLLCEPERIVTRRAEDGTYSLLAGQAAGVTSGVQFILVRSAGWERDRLDIKDVAELALARVEFVYPQESAIKVIAGPNAPDSGSLIAIPF